MNKCTIKKCFTTSMDSKSDATHSRDKRRYKSNEYNKY